MQRLGHATPPGSVTTSSANPGTGLRSPRTSETASKPLIVSRGAVLAGHDARNPGHIGLGLGWIAQPPGGGQGPSPGAQGALYGSPGCVNPENGSGLREPGCPLFGPQLHPDEIPCRGARCISATGLLHVRARRGGHGHPIGPAGRGRHHAECRPDAEGVLLRCRPALDSCRWSAQPVGRWSGMIIGVQNRRPPALTWLGHGDAAVLAACLQRRGTARTVTAASRQASRARASWRDAPVALLPTLGGVRVCRTRTVVAKAL
jgi:hypothetical protein